MKSLNVLVALPILLAFSARAERVNHADIQAVGKMTVALNPASPVSDIGTLAICLPARQWSFNDGRADWSLKSTPGDFSWVDSASCPQQGCLRYSPEAQSACYLSGPGKTMDDLYSLMRALISGRITKHMRVKTSSGLHQIGTFLAGDGSPPEGGSGNDGMPGGSGNDGT